MYELRYRPTGLYEDNILQSLYILPITFILYILLSESILGKHLQVAIINKRFNKLLDQYNIVR